MTRSNEQGFAMIVALFMVLALSVVASSLMFTARTETVSSHNYRLMSQARYGAESAVHSAADYLVNTYAAPTQVGGTDPVANYVMTSSPVTYNGNPVVLSSDASLSNYPVNAVKTAFAAAAQGNLDVKDGTVAFRATARLLGMRTFFDEIAATWRTVQTWELTGLGSFDTSAVPAQVEVSTILERQPMPVYAYAAFATYDGCGALNFIGGANTDSYDSRTNPANTKPVPDAHSGNVGTNGNLDGNGMPTHIYGNLSTPRTGVGACSSANVTAATLQGANVVANGLNKLSQPVKFPTPEVLNPLPPTTNTDIKKTGGCTADIPYCALTANGKSITPPANTTVYMGNVDINANADLTLSAGTYVINSLNMNGGSTLNIDSTAGPVIIKIEGAGVSTPLVINGNGISNPSYVPSDLRFIYGGTGDIKLTGGEMSSSLIYAPNASATINGQADLYGSIVVHDMKESGGAAIHYDRALSGNTFTLGSHTLSSFNWSSAVN